MKKILFVLACAMVCCTMAAKDKTKKTAKGKKQKAPVEVVDTVSADIFSFHIGRANTNGLKQYLMQRMGVEEAYMDAFLEGFDVGEMGEAEKRMKARLAGMEIRSQVEQQVMPGISKQMNDSVNLLNNTEFLRGFRAGIKGEEVPGVSMDSTQTLVQKQMAYYTNTNLERKYGANRKAGEEFLKANGKKKDVVTLPSGLQYKVITKGEGEIPTATQKVKVHYRGTLIDGTEFDSSYKRNQPATFGCNQVIKGWSEALTMMPVGSKWELYIPYQLAYGDRESGGIPPFSCLLFEVELLEIVK